MESSRIDAGHPDFWKLYVGVTREMFRFEGRQEYDLRREGDLVEAYRCGDRTPVPAGRWDALMRTHADHERDLHRVRLVEMPWTDYTAWELHGYATNEAHGERIRVLAADHPSVIEVRGDDFLIIDGAGWKMAYDDEGVLLHVDRVSGFEAASYRKRRDAAMRVSVPLSQYLAMFGDRRIS